MSWWCAGWSWWSGRSWSWWQEPQAQASSSSRWQEPQQESGPGDGVPGRKEPRKMVPPGDVIYTIWPVSVTGYPAQGLPNSWREIWDMVQELGHDITLAGRYTTKRSMHGANERPGRSPKLTLRGPRVREVFRLVVQKTKAAGISLWKSPWPLRRGRFYFMLLYGMRS